MHRRPIPFDDNAFPGYAERREVGVGRGASHDPRISGVPSKARAVTLPQAAAPVTSWAAWDAASRQRGSRLTVRLTDAAMTTWRR